MISVCPRLFIGKEWGVWVDEPDLANGGVFRLRLVQQTPEQVFQLLCALLYFIEGFVDGFGTDDRFLPRPRAASARSSSSRYSMKRTSL